ncbi:amidohydrolase [Roseimaritima sediminicola]|uniref:amidohydrolase n=1 Tax=Roseimaritima sediminicola TaxID=2662066 RepID=UPI0012983357|nr:amidohydrolase [Roseimaritima sediminicola]
MTRWILLGLLAAMLIADNRAHAQSVEQWYEAHCEAGYDLYKWLHANPELSFEEEQTAAKLAALWRDAGYEVTTGIGGHGIVGILRNGDGPVLMLRTDLDALPVTEQTPLEFASQKTTTLAGGGQSGIMHACGHDLHMTNLTMTAQYLAANPSRWSGTLMLVGQPAEERGAGAKAMLEDGLFERFPKPDYAVALHVESSTPAGSVRIRSGFVLANVDSVDITVKGRGGHGATPHDTIDPITQAAELVMSLQLIVSREVKPIEPAVVTVGSIQGGTKHNIIGNECKLQITVRSYSDEVRQQVLDAIRRRALAIAEANRAPAPEVRISEGTPSLENDAELAARLATVFRKTLGEDHVLEAEPAMGGEDFSRYGRAGVPIVMYRLGTIRPQRLERFAELGVRPPSLHSSSFYPDLEPTLSTGVRSLTAAALDLLSREADRKE